MTYRELIELYKQGKLEEEKCKEVEADIEKQDAISEYLFDRDEQELQDLLNDNSCANTVDEKMKETNKEESKDFAKMINRSIRRAFIKMGAIVAMLVVVAILFIQFGLPKVVSSHYYNPDKMIGENTNQMSLDMAVYTELFVPENRREFVSVTDNGYGNYEFVVHQDFSYNGIFTDVSGKISQNKLVFYNSNIIDRPETNVFEWSNPDLKSSASIREQMKQIKAEYGENDTVHFEYSVPPEDAKEMIEGLEKDKYYNAYVCFDQIMEYRDFVSFIKNYNDLAEVWCAVVVKENGERLDVNNMGFNYRKGGGRFLDWDKDRYSYFLQCDDDIDEEEQAANHFISLIKYMCEQKKFVQMMDQRCVDEEMVDYVEENGLKIYGFQTVAEKEDLQKLMNEKEVYSIDLKEIR